MSQTDLPIKCKGSQYGQIFLIKFTDQIIEVLISVWNMYRGTVVVFEVNSVLPPSEYSFYWSPLHGFKIVCFELNFHETEKKKRLKYHHQAHCTLFALLFSHIGLHIQNIFAISRDGGNERDKQREMYRKRGGRIWLVFSQNEPLKGEHQTIMLQSQAHVAI